MYEEQSLLDNRDLNPSLRVLFPDVLRRNGLKYFPLTISRTCHEVVDKVLSLHNFFTSSHILDFAKWPYQKEIGLSHLH